MARWQFLILLGCFQLSCVRRFAEESITKSSAADSINFLQKVGYLDKKEYASNAAVLNNLAQSWKARCGGKNIKNLEAFLTNVVRYRNIYPSAPWHQAVAHKP